MDATTFFAQTPTTPEPVIAQVRRQLADDPRHFAHITPRDLDREADLAVRALWGSRVKTFVPVLALRQAREALVAREATDQPEPRWLPDQGSPPSSGTLLRTPGARDVLLVVGDALRVDDGDVLRH